MEPIFPVPWIQSCVATAKKYGVARNTVSHWLKKKTEIFEAVERNNV